MRGGFPTRTMNVFLIRSEDGVVVFDAGIKSMVGSVLAAGAELGGIERVVLGHAHVDHRGTAPSLGAPVFCHPDEVADAESERGEHYFDVSKLSFPARLVFPKLLRHWDGGPVRISGTVEEGNEVAGFRVVHLPGHAPGLIALFRERDRLALVSDAFYLVDPETGRPCPPRLPHDCFNQDRTGACGSLERLAELRPRVAWPGHLGPLTGDVRAQLLGVVEAEKLSAQNA